MRDLSTVSNEVSARAVIIVQLEDRIAGTPRWLKIDPEEQGLTFGRLRVQYPPSTLKQVFLLLKPVLEQKALDEGRPIQIDEAEIDLSLLADYIGFLRGYWEDPYVKKVSFENTPTDGVILKLPQSGSEESLNYVVQRFIHNKSRQGLSPAIISTELVSMHAKANLNHTALNAKSILRLRCLIFEKVQQHPADEGNHWNNVGQQYGRNEDMYSLDTHYILKGQPNRPAMPAGESPESASGQGASLAAPASQSPGSSRQESKSPMDDLMMHSGRK